MAKRETTEFWQGHFEEWQQSGLTQVAYCERNIAFIRDHLKIEGLLVTSEDVGETFPRYAQNKTSQGRSRIVLS